jgi:hypothetical protein
MFTDDGGDEARERPAAVSACHATGKTWPGEPSNSWQSMSRGKKQAWLLNQALDCKREILTLPMPDPADDSAEAHRIRMLLLATADSTIEQVIRMQPPATTTSNRSSRNGAKRRYCQSSACAWKASEQATPRRSRTTLDRRLTVASRLRCWKPRQEIRP